MSELDFSEAKKWLEHGRIKELAEQCGLDATTASKMLSGKVKKPNIKFLNAVMDEALKNKRMLTEKNKALKIA